MTSAVGIEDVRREVKILKALSGHQNLVHFHDAFEDANNIYMVMEYVFVWLFWLLNRANISWFDCITPFFNMYISTFGIRLCEGGELLERIVSR